MKNKILTKILTINLYILLALILSVIVYFTGQNKTFSDFLVTMAVVSLLQLILNMFFLKLRKINLFSPISLFIIFLYIFNFGQVLLKGFVPNYDFLFDVSDHIGQQLYIKTSIFCLVIIFLFVVGVLISYKDVNASKDMKDYHEHYYIYCKPIGFILLFLSLPFMLYLDITKILASISGGYQAIFDIEKPGFFGILSYLFLPAIILLLFAYKDNKFTVRVIFILTVLYKIMTMLGGQRGYAVVFIIVLSYIFVSKVQRISLRNSILYTFIAYFILNILSVIKSIRGISDKNFGTLSNAFSETLENNIIFKTLEEFGGTLYTTSLALSYYPDTLSNLHGSGYFFPLLTVFPNVGGILNQFTDNNWAVQLSSLVPGIGGSFIAEIYVNFGQYFSYLFPILLGMLMGKLSYIYEQKVKYNHYLIISMYAITFSMSLLWVRGSFEILVRNTIWPAIMIYLLYFILKNTFRKKASIKFE